MTVKLKGGYFSYLVITTRKPNKHRRRLKFLGLYLQQENMQVINILKNLELQLIMKILKFRLHSHSESVFTHLHPSLIFSFLSSSLLFPFLVGFCLVSSRYFFIDDAREEFCGLMIFLLSISLKNCNQYHINDNLKQNI